MEATSSEQPKHDPLRLPYVAWALAVIVLLSCTIFLLPFVIALSDLPGVDEERAKAIESRLVQFSNLGQWFGCLGAVSSAFALTGVVYAVILQRRQLAEQRRELVLTREQLKLTREELKRSAVAQEKTEKALNEQVQATLDASFLNAASALAQTYAQIYSSNTDEYDRIYETLCEAVVHGVPNAEVEFEQTVKARLLNARAQLESLFKTLRLRSQIGLDISVGVSDFATVEPDPDLVRPKLILSFDPETDIMNLNDPRFTYPGIHTRWARIKVKNISKSKTARGCNACLVRVDHVASNGPIIGPLLTDFRPLMWTHGGPGSLNTDLTPQSEKLIDLACAARHGYNDSEVSFQLQTNPVTLIGQFGDYVMTIRVGAEEMEPEEIRVRLTWTGVVECMIGSHLDEQKE